MNKLQSLLISSMVLLALITSCQSKPKNGRTDTYASGKITIAVDESFAPIIEQEIAQFQAAYPQAKIVAKYVTEVDAINNLLKCKDLWLAITSRRLTPEEIKSFNDRTYYPKVIEIATDGLALIVNKHNPDTLITVNQIRSILTGKPKTWRDIYPKSPLKDLMIVFDNPNSSTVRFAIDSICKGQAMPDNVRAVKNNTEVIDFVSKHPEAIGIVGVSWLSNNNDSTKLSFSKKVKVMSVSNANLATPDNSFKPYQAYLYYENYPLVRSIYMLLNDPMNGLPWGFEAFVSSDKGQRIILKSGLVPATQPVRVVKVDDNN